MMDKNIKLEIEVATYRIQAIAKVLKMASVCTDYTDLELNSNDIEIVSDLISDEAKLIQDLLELAEQK